MSDQEKPITTSDTLQPATTSADEQQQSTTNAANDDQTNNTPTTTTTTTTTPVATTNTTSRKRIRLASLNHDEEAEEEAQDDENNNKKTEDTNNNNNNKKRKVVLLTEEEQAKENFKTRLAHEIESLMNNTHEQFLVKCESLKKMREIKREAAEKYRDIQIQNLRNICDAEIKQANDDFENEVSQFRERMLNMLMDKQSKGENAPDAHVFDYESLDKTPMTASAGVVGGASTRKLRKRKGEDTGAATTNGGQNGSHTSTHTVQVKFGYAALDKYTKKRILPDELSIKSFSLSADEIAQDLNQITRKAPSPAPRVR